MKKQAIIMGMPVIVDVLDKGVTNEDISEVFSYFHYIDNKFSTYKKNSEISRINRKELKSPGYSSDMKKILYLCGKTKKETNGYFNININGILDPSGLVKGFAIFQACKILKNKHFSNFYIEIAGDIQVCGSNKGRAWRVGIKNPFNTNEIVKVIALSDKGIATSGSYMRGQHILNPKTKNTASDIESLTVIGENIYDADRFATAAFAMGEKGINFIENLKGFEGYMIKKNKHALSTTGFENYVLLN